MALVAALGVMAVLAGIALAIDTARGRPAPSGRPDGGAGAPTALLRRLYKPGRLGRRTRLLLLAGLGAGMLIWLTTGWIAAVVILPAALAGTPILLVRSDQGATIDRLEAIQEWTRSLAGGLTVGMGIENAIEKTERSIPEPIQAEVGMLINRLRARWKTPDALRAFADDLDDNVGDQIVYLLLNGVQQRGEGLSRVLERLADTVARNVRRRRETEADQAKTRTTARWVTLIGLAVMLVLAVFKHDYIASYKSGAGQPLLLLLLGAYAGCLVWLRRAAVGTPPPRLLGTTVQRPGGES